MNRIAFLGLALVSLTHALAEPGDLQPALDDAFVEADSALATSFVRYCDAATRRDRAPSSAACTEAEKEFQAVMATHDRRAIRLLQSATEHLSDGCAPYAWEALLRVSPEKFEERRELASRQKDAPACLPRWIDSARKQAAVNCTERR